jgi:hypothetical protein
VASKRKVKSYNGDPADAAELVVTYWPATPPTPPTPPAGPPKNFDSATRTVLVTDSGANDWIGRSDLQISNDGSLWFMTYKADVSHITTAACRGHIRFSEDEGENWTAEDTFIDGGAVTNWPIQAQLGGNIDPQMLVVCDNDDLLFLVPEGGGVRFGTRQYRSTDDGDTWSDEGVVTDVKTNLYLSWINVSGDLYALGTYDNAGGGSAHIDVVLWKSTDDGANWNKVSDVAVAAEECNESGFTHTGSGRFVVILRDDNNLKTYERTSADYGATWGALYDVTAQLGVFQRARLFQFDDGYDRIYMVGRGMIGAAPSGYTIIYFSDDGGITWDGGYVVSAYYADCAYCQVQLKSDGDLYILTYEGTMDDADLVEYIVEMS